MKFIGRSCDMNDNDFTWELNVFGDCVEIKDTLLDH